MIKTLVLYTIRRPHSVVAKGRIVGLMMARGSPFCQISLPGCCTAVALNDSNCREAAKFVAFCPLAVDRQSEDDWCLL
jgi:hypothetical protein